MAQTAPPTPMTTTMTMALAFETVYGTPPASGYRLMPFTRTMLGAEQPLLNSELLGYGRDPLAPIKDAVTADGEVVVPIDVEAFGFWLKGAFGAPTTTGTTPKTHTFQSGNWTLPSMAIEVAMPELWRVVEDPDVRSFAAINLGHTERRVKKTLGIA
jgi:hypothetical protein